MGQYKVDINGEIIQNRNRDAHGPPKLLGLVLGRDKVTSLREFLLRIARTRPEASRLSVTLQGPNDHPSYQRLLDTTWCYLTPGSADLEAGFSLKQSWSQAQVWPWLLLLVCMCIHAAAMNMCPYTADDDDD